MSIHDYYKRIYTIVICIVRNKICFVFVQFLKRNQRKSDGFLKFILTSYYPMDTSN